MKIFLQGDFITNTGPAIANRNLRNSLEYCAFINTSDQQGIISRIVESILKTVEADKVILCSFSKSNWITIFTAKIMKKSVYYYMHGSQRIEAELNGTLKKRVKLEERMMLQYVSKIICVSNLQKKKISSLYPEYLKKIIVHYNCFLLDNFIFNNCSKGKKKKMILSTGGGMPQKANLIVCEAIKKLKAKREYEFEYIVVGKSCGFINKFEEYDFVKYYESLPQKQIWNLMKQCNIYIQNSKFETFGMAVLEALLQGASILAGINIGSLELLKEVTENDIITNFDDPDEIAKKLDNLLIHENATRLFSNMKFEDIDLRKSGKKLLEKLIIERLDK